MPASMRLKPILAISKTIFLSDAHLQIDKCSRLRRISSGADLGGGGMLPFP